MIVILTMNDGSKQGIPCKGFKETHDGWYEFDLGNRVDKSIRANAVKKVEVINGNGDSEKKKEQING